MSLGLIALVGVLMVVVVTSLAPRVGVAPPLLLVGLGFAATFLPFVDSVTVPPELILAGVLPPLLYSAAVSAPPMEFRRDLGLISVFSVFLVIVTAVLVGVVVHLLVPAVPLALGIALGAIISPTDAVATSIVRQAGVSARIATVLEGESMLNDASALVLLRSAVAAAAATISLWQVTADFAWAVVVAVAIGWAVGKLHLLARRHVPNTSASVALSLVIPYLAYLPAEHVGASGLLAAVSAGLVTGHGAVKVLTAEERLAERAVWRTVELLAESAVFALVGLELPALLADLTSAGGLGQAALLTAVTATIAIAVRAVFVAWSVRSLARHNRRGPAVRDHLTELQQHLDEGTVPQVGSPKRTGRRHRSQDEADALRERWQRLLSRRLADLDYLAAEAFGWREGVILVWAGMRGAVTIAAAQTLAAGTAHRSLLVVVATLVAVGTLVIQGGTLGWLAEKLGVTGVRTEGSQEQWEALQADLNLAMARRLDDPTLKQRYPEAILVRLRDQLRRPAASDEEDDPEYGDATARARRAGRRALGLELVEARRAELLVLRDLGTYPTSMLDTALTRLDTEQLGLELKPW